MKMTKVVRTRARAESQLKLILKRNGAADASGDGKRLGGAHRSCWGEVFACGRHPKDEEGNCDAREALKEERRDLADA